MMPIPDPIWLYRFIHLDNLDLLLRRGGLNAPNHAPDDASACHTIYDGVGCGELANRINPPK